MRLACVKHAASVHSEPGSNSPIKLFQVALATFVTEPQLIKLSLFSFQRSNFVSYLAGFRKAKNKTFIILT